MDALGSPSAVQGPVRLSGSESADAALAVAPGHTYLIRVQEQGNDARIELLDPDNGVIARADHPERRTGTRWLVTVAASPSLRVRATGKEHAGASGSITAHTFDVAALQARPDCLAAFEALAAADDEYAAAGEVSRRSVGSSVNTHEIFLRAAREYSIAEAAFAASGDRRLRGETALALAGIEYFDLQDWAQAADWAEAAASTLTLEDQYRRARAEALLAASWIEIGSSRLLVQARHLLRQLAQFHLGRGETYDAGLQMTNIGLTYLNEGSFPECIAASARASHLFEALHETQRRAVARQNGALCLWGLGRLPEALRGFERALTDIGPEPYPLLYMAVITNTALADYALGHLDESLRLYDRALAFAEKIQNARFQAYCLYGIGVNYYALGDRQRARGFLERSLAIRTVAFDARGRTATLRALATLDAEQGRLERALAYDREALGLAIAPSAVARIRIQEAAHTAAGGHPQEAEALLDEVIATDAKRDPLVQGEALLQRAKVRRNAGHAREAISDLTLARGPLHEFGSVMEEFEADLELARALQQQGEPRGALEAVDRALAQSDAVRLQSANPELRAELQTPLRPAYDLRLDLLWDRYQLARSAGHEAEASALAAAAFGTADAARAHSFAELAARSYSPPVRQALTAELRRREELYRELAARRFALDARLERSESDDPGVQRLLADIAELRRQVDTVNTGIARRTVAHGATLRTGLHAPEVASLPGDTALLSYWLGSESAYAWVVSSGRMHWVRLTAPAAIAAQATAFHHSLTRLVDTPEERRLQEGRSLYTAIIGPLEPWLAGVRNWIVIPDGALDYVPFAALPMRDSAQASFVVLEHDVVVAPAAWMLARKGRAPQHAGRILIVADPVYGTDDPRLAAAPTRASVARKAVAENTASVGRRSDGPAAPQYQRLRFSAAEAAGISTQFPPAQVEELIGLDATRERLLALDWSQYRFIHIATHGVVDAQVPELSALILGSYDERGEVGDRAVRVADVSVKTLNAEVAVLSACDTALGTEVRTEGLVGLSSTMLARGAHTVVASLWPVPDRLGAQLMTEFYRHMLRDSMSPQEALGSAMRSMAGSAPSADPALWGAFQISVASLEPRPSAHPAVVEFARQ